MGRLGMLLAGALVAGALCLTENCSAETLEDAWSAALANDQRLQAVKTRTMAAEAELAAAKANRYPTLGVASTFSRFDDSPAAAFGTLALPMFTNDNFLTATASVSVPLFTSGLIRGGIDAASAGLDANVGRQEAFTQDLRLEVAQSFVAVLRAQRAVEVAASNVESLESHAVDVENLYDKGLAPQNDLLAVQVSLADARQSSLRADNTLDVARAAYNRRLGRALDSAASLDEIMPAVAQVAMGSDLEALTAAALERRTELEALTAQATALQHLAEVERARTRPQFSASAGYAYLENELLVDETFALASIGFTWSPFDGGRSRHRASALNRQGSAVELQRDDLATLIRLQVRSTWLDLQEATDRLSVTEKAIVQAEENLRVAKTRYQNGIGTNTEVLDAETLRSLSRSNHNNARYDAALARLRLARSIGVL